MVPCNQLFNYSTLPQPGYWIQKERVPAATGTPLYVAAAVTTVTKTGTKNEFRTAGICPL